MFEIEWRQDYTALILSYVYVFGVLLVGELFHRMGGRPVEFTRKLVHVGVGMWSVGTVLLFENWEFAIIPPVTFVLINAFSYWRGTFKSMEGEEQENLGTVYFPIAFGAIIYLFWDQPTLLVASLMPMTWGDAMAATVGRRWGEYTYSIGGSTRSVEGSVAMLFWSWIAAFLALLLMPYLLGQSPLDWLPMLLYAGVVAVVATIVEALSPWGIDNLTVPAAAVVVLNMLFG
ncbi:MAG: phosphatidate cytidylyltransferase [Anaerolineae bacterium]|nr:phosphatidate cytidylyltransferase [Anaerolineae bacterium]